MILRKIAVMTKYVGSGTKNLYLNHKPTQGTVNTFGIYAGVRIAGRAGSTMFNCPEAAEISDFLAPIASGAYAVVKTSSMPDKGKKDFTQIAIAALVGGELSRQMLDYSGGNDAIRAIRDGIDGMCTGLSNWQNVHYKPAMGAEVGAGLGAVGRFIKYLIIV